MNRRYIIITIGTAAILALGFFCYLSLPKEPRYEGRSLSQWLERGSRDSRYLYILAGERTDPDFVATCTALQAIGTNALPFLIKWSFAHDSKTSEAIISWLDSRLPPSYGLWWAAKRRFAAELGFRLLEDKAKPAWPVFIQWTADKDPDRRQLGLDCLLYTKADKATVLPVFQRMLNDPDKGVRQAAAYEFFYRHRKEAVAADVYTRFPQLHLPYTATPDADTNQPAQTK